MPDPHEPGDYIGAPTGTNTEKSYSPSLKDRLAQREDAESEVLRAKIDDLEARMEELTEFKPGHRTPPAD